MPKLSVAIAILIAAFAVAAFAQERAPAERQTLVDLAYVLGESHALRQACAGAEDQFWRQKMMRLGETEAADEAFDARMKQAFNAGYASRQTEFPACSPASYRAEATAAARGQVLATQMAASVRPVKRMGPDTPAPDSVAEPDSPR